MGTRERDASRMALYGADGTTVRVPDSTENRAHFGGQKTRWDSTSGYPLVRLVTLMALRAHILAGARFGPYGTDERVYADELWSLVPDRSLTILDRGFHRSPRRGRCVRFDIVAVGSRLRSCSRR